MAYIIVTSLVFVTAEVYRSAWQRKILLKKSSSVKVLFLVDYDSLKFGVVRDGLTTILNEFTDFGYDRYWCKH